MTTMRPSERVSFAQQQCSPTTRTVLCMVQRYRYSLSGVEASAVSNRKHLFNSKIIAWSSEDNDEARLLLIHYQPLFLTRST